MPTTLEIHLASVVAHLLEHIDTGEHMDIVAAAVILDQKDVHDALEDMRASALVPLRRDGNRPFVVKS